MRFRAAWTNGGVDEDLPRYRMDNMLNPTRWESHCTALGRNVDVIGFLLVSLEASDLTWFLSAWPGSCNRENTETQSQGCEL